jgi:hypothetical protein
MPEDTPSWKIFVYTFIGLTVPVVLIDVLGAAFGAALSVNPTWATGYAENSMGGVLGAALAPLNGFGTVYTFDSTLMTVLYGRSDSEYRRRKPTKQLFSRLGFSKRASCLCPGSAIFVDHDRHCHLRRHCYCSGL